MILKSVVLVGLALAASFANAGVGSNLVKNGGFEDGKKEWSYGSLLGDNPPVDIEIDSSVAHSGKSSMRFSRTDKRFMPVAMMMQEIAYDGQQKLQVSLWAKADGVHKFTLAVLMQGREGRVEWGAY